MNTATITAAGTVSETGEDQGLILAVRMDGAGGGRFLDWADLTGPASETTGAGPLWAHLNYTDANAARWLYEESGLDPVVAEALLADETRPRCAVMGAGLLLSLRGVNTHPGADPDDLVSVRLYCTAERVISTRRRRLASIRDLEHRLRRGEGPRAAGELLAQLADGLTERMADVLADQEARIDALEENILEGSDQTARKDLLDLRREIIQLRRYLAPQREALNRLHQDKAAWLSENDRLHLREAADKITRYVEDLDAARDRAAVAYEELSNRLAEQMNARMYVLSLVAGLFLPLGFLTGLLGVNVGGVPLAENPYGFWFVALGMAAILGLQSALFRHRKWF